MGGDEGGGCMGMGYGLWVYVIGLGVGGVWGTWVGVG